MKKIIYFSMVAGIGLATLSCSKSTKPESETKEISKSETNTQYNIGDRVPNELVCMINNEYMGGKPQIPVQVGDITYYGCCENCKITLNEDPKSRKAQDPQTGKEVDKASAYIVLTGDYGKISYFESEATYNQYKAK